MKTFDLQKTNEVTQEVIELLNKSKLTLHESVIVVGKLLYSMGSQMNNFIGAGPTLEEVKQKYYTEPTNLGNALILTGLTIQSWLQDIK